MPLRHGPLSGCRMEKDAKEALQVAKEIVVKFIETNRVSPANVHEVFPQVYRVVLETITRPNLPADNSFEPSSSETPEP